MLVVLGSMACIVVICLPCCSRKTVSVEFRNDNIRRGAALEVGFGHIVCSRCRAPLSARVCPDHSKEEQLWHSPTFTSSVC